MVMDAVFKFKGKPLPCGLQQSFPFSENGKASFLKFLICILILFFHLQLFIN